MDLRGARATRDKSATPGAASKLAVTHDHFAAADGCHRIPPHVTAGVRRVIALAVQHVARQDHLLVRIDDDQIGVVAGLNCAFATQLEDARRVAAGQAGEALERQATGVDSFAEQQWEQRLSARNAGVDRIE